MKGDRDLVSIERSLGLRSVRGISRQSNKDSPPIKAILEGIRVIATQYVTKSNGEIRASHALQQDALNLLAQYGPDIWPGPEHERPPWLEDPSEHNFEDKYPRHLYFTNPEDRQILGERFYALVVEKCCNYHDNQLQKHRRVSAKKQASNDDSASVTPRREDLPWFVDGGHADGGDSDDVEMEGADAPPTNSWSAVNNQPTHVTAPPPALTSPIETPEVMPHGLPGIYEPKKEPSPASPVQNGTQDNVEMSFPAATRPKSRSQPPKEFGYSFSDYYIEGSHADSDGQSGRKRKREPYEEQEIPPKRSHRDDEEEEEDEMTNGHHALLVKFKVNSAKLAEILSKEPRPGSFSNAFFPRPPSPARTTSSIADGSAYQGELGRTRGRSKLDSLKTETIVHVTQYRDKRGKWYEVDIDSRPDWATDERIITRSVPRGRPPSNYVNRREGSSRASSLARSVTHASERRSSAVVHSSREESEQVPSRQDEAPQPPREEAEPETQKNDAERPTTKELSAERPSTAEGRQEDPAKEKLQGEVHHHRGEACDAESGENQRPKEAQTPEMPERRRSSVKLPESGPEPDRRSMPPPSHIPAQVSSSHVSPERLRVVPLTTLAGPPMLTPRPTHGMGEIHHLSGPFDDHAQRQSLQPQPPGFRLHPQASPQAPPHAPPPVPHHTHQPPPSQVLPSQHEPSPQAHRVGLHEPPATVLRTIYAHPGVGAPPRAEPQQARYSGSDGGLQRKHSLPLGVPLEIRPDIPKDQVATNGIHTRGPPASEPPAVTAAPAPDQIPRWASVNAREPAPQQAILGARREDKDATPTGTPIRSPGIAHGDVQQLPTRRPIREAPYAQPPQHAAAASTMQMTWNPTADNILGEFIHCPVGRHLQSVETPRNLLAVYKEIFIEEPAARTDFHTFSILSERRRQDQRYVQEAIRKHVNPAHPADLSIPPPGPPPSKSEEQRIAPQPPRQPEPFSARYSVPNSGPPMAPLAPSRDRIDSIPPRDAVSGAQPDTSPCHGHMHIDHTAPRAPLPKPPILPSQALKSEIAADKPLPASPSSASVGGASLENVTVEINWGRSLDFSDYMPMKDCTTAKEFFELVEAQLPDELRGEGKKIKEIRVKALTELAGGNRLPRITRDEGPGRISLRQLVKKLRSQPAGSEPELEFLVVWEGIPVN